jgi:DoxX-like family
MTGFTAADAGRGRAVYWTATLLVTAEMGVGGMWDVLRISQVRDVVAHLGYPSYFLVLLGTWKILGALALLAPRLPLLKEWAYAGAIFTDTGAIVSHQLRELAFLIPLTALTALSWWSRPASRRVPGRAGPAEAFALSGGSSLHRMVREGRGPRARSRR